MSLGDETVRQGLDRNAVEAELLIDACDADLVTAPAVEGLREKHIEASEWRIRLAPETARSE